MERKKARNGDGSITSRQTATKGLVWDVQLTVKDRRGLAHRTSKRGFKTEKAAIMWRDAQKQRSRAGQMVKGPSLTVPGLCDRYIDSSPHLRGSSEKVYRSAVNKHIRPRLDIRVDNLTPNVMQEFLDETVRVMGERGRSGSGTVKRCLAVVRAALSWASSADQGLIGHNPLAGSRIRDRSKQVHRSSLTALEVDSLLSGSTGRSALAWRLFLETGMRKGEVLALSFSDIDWGDGTVRIGATLTAEGGGWRVVERVKSGTAHIMPLSDRLTALLRAELNDDGISPRTYVFQGAHGRPVTPSSLERWWARDCKAAGLSGRVIHELRHTWATRALEAGVQPSVVAKIMGHANVATTLRHYRHVSMDEMRLAVNLVSSKLPQGPVVVTANVTAGESQAPESRG